MLHSPNNLRVRKGIVSSDDTFGNTGTFAVYSKIASRAMIVMVSEEMGWEKVSVTLKNRFPNMIEIKQVKGLFWDDSDIVIQFFCERDHLVDGHPYSIHLWRQKESRLDTPPNALFNREQK